jgi:hydrogenase expression/formation protein HypE
VKFIRDVTRGGLATILNEIIQEKDMSILLQESSIPVREEVVVVCEILGLDPLYIANEGKIILIVSKEDANEVIKTLKNNPLGKNAEVIGEFVHDDREKVYLKTEIKGTRILGMLEEEIIPRIC